MTAHSEALQNALAFHQEGDLAQAERCYREILSAEPAQFDALHYLGMLEAQSGRYVEALRLISGALDINPQSIEALMSRANVLATLGRHAEALATCERALVLKPDFALAHYNRGNILHEQGRHEEALASYDKVLASMPDNAPALFSRGNLLHQLGRNAQALGSYDKFLALMPENVEALYNRGVVLHKLQRYDEALASYDHALRLAPDDVDVLTNRGIALYEVRRFDEALASYDRALASRPDFVEALNNRANALRELNRPADALASCDEALAIRPDYLEALNNRGLALQALNRNREALASYDRALAINPNYADAHWAASLCSLALGDFERGWGEYEWRWKTEDFPSPRRNFAQSLWLGQATLKGKTILLYGEQGLGDTLQFCRYVPLVAEMGARIILEVQPPLKSLLMQIPGVDRVLAKGEALPTFDFQSPLLSLPLAFKTMLATLPAPPSYLNAAPELVEKWRILLGPRDVPRVGIVWSGSATHRNQRNRALGLAPLLSLAKSGVRLVSLQKELEPADRELLEQHADVMHFEQELEDFSDTAAACALMDLIISVDTSVAHLAGAMGKPVWIMLPYIAEWRWMTEGEQSPWYPTARLFRQARPADWESVIARIAVALAEFRAAK